MTRLLPAALVAAGLAVAQPGAALPATTAAAATAVVQQTSTWPASGTLEVQGHGSGHGRGMSQWGAYGAAVKGLTYQQILAFYYPGTALAVQAEPTLRVLVVPDDDDVTEIVPTAGVGVTTDKGTVADLPTKNAHGTITRWRAVRSGDTVRLQYLADTWRGATVGGAATHSYVDFDPGTAGTVRLVLPDRQRAYRGVVRATQSGTGLVSVVRTSLTDYLRSVVPSEVSSTWRAEALKAQAVASRTYALHDRASKPADSPYDTCDTSCQSFNGVADYSSSGALQRTYEAAASDAAVTATRGSVVTYQGALAFTQFSAADGGWTTDGGQPYLVAKADPYDGVVASTSHTWVATISASAVAAAYPGLGTLESVTLTRDGRGEQGGRITQVVLHGSTSDITTTGSTFADRLGLRQSWWAPSSAGWHGYAVVVGPGDWDGDRNPDLLARATDGRLYLLPGPTSPLGARRQIGTGFGAFTALVAVGDWDGDRNPDLLARKQDGTLWLYRGNGSGGFAGWKQVGTGFGSFTALLGPGDWDGDRNPDLLGRTAGGELRLYRGNGHGGFAGRQAIGHGFQTFDALVAPGDWDGDRHADLLARKADGGLWLYRGDGTGGFASWRLLSRGWQAFDLVAAAGTLDTDVYPDLVARTPAGTAYLYPGNGTGGFHARSVTGSP